MINSPSRFPPSALTSYDKVGPQVVSRESQGEKEYDRSYALAPNALRLINNIH